MPRERPPSRDRSCLKSLRLRLENLLLAVLFALSVAAPAAAAVVARRVMVMGTTLEVTVTAPTRAAALAGTESAIRAVERTEARLSTWRRDSELSALNATPVGRPMRLSRALAEDLALARRYWVITGGAFDPGIGALVAAWGLRTGGRRPLAMELEAALAAGGVGRLALEGDSAVRLDTAVLIEEGAFAKGIALDAAIAAVGARARVLLDLGGQLAAGDGEALNVAIGHPDRRNEPVLHCVLRRGSIATTGSSERGITLDGARLGHILDPRTGYPAPDFGSLSVWAPTATAADCLSTGLYVLGPEGALAWAGEHAEVGVLVLERTATRVRARASAGWPGHLEAASAAVVVERTAAEAGNHCGPVAHGPNRGVP